MKHQAETAWIRLKYTWYNLNLVGYFLVTDAKKNTYFFRLIERVLNGAYSSCYRALVCQQQNLKEKMTGKSSYGLTI